MISAEKRVYLSRAMQLLMVGILGVGLYYKSPGIIVNAAVSLAISFLPELLERNYRISMTPGLVLWLTTAVFLHAFGTLGPYGNVWWWDHLTHMVSSSLVAGAGYATVRALQEHVEGISLPGRYMFVFILMFVMAFGVAWEVLEFAIALIADVMGTGTVLTQYGLDDTMKDLIFDLIGGSVVAILGEAHLSGFANEISEKLDESLGRPVE
jgi:uncharacterized membrane protein YjdF